MTLSPGARLGPYEIVAQAGAGGMGEVYKARDTRLDRFVAVKVLPHKFAGRDDLRQRFEREAKIISGLNHPNICTLHDVGQQDGAHYLVMEFLEGETLAARIGRGAVPLQESLSLATQIAAGLAEAHRAEVTHRDLKPANVMLTRTGVKILDFGLAKPLLSSKPIGENEPTLTDALSGEGAILGTLQYMSPEQLESKDADERSDIFALGCVLYEMLTGKRVFSGGSAASIIGAIMSGDAPALSELQAIAPESLERLIRQCMRRNPDDRFQSAHDIKLQLEWIRQPIEDKQVESPPPPPSRPWVWVGVSAVLALALAAAIVFRPSNQAPETPLSLDVQSPIRGGLVRRLYVSPDGKSIAFGVSAAQGSGTYMRSLASTASRRIAENGAPAGFSFDGKSLFISTGSDLRRIDLASGTPTNICSCRFSGLDQGPDGTVYLGSARGPLLRVPASGGQPTPLWQLSKESGVLGQRYPVVLPDGKRILFSASFAMPELDGIYVAALDGSAKPKKVFTSSSRFYFISPNLLVVGHGDGFASVTVDLDNGGSPGEPRIIASQVQPGEAASYAPSRDGRVIAYLPEDLSSTRNFTVLGKDGRVIRNLGFGNGIVAHPDYSPDGKRLVMERRFSGSTNATDIWTYDLERDALSRMTFSPELDGPSTWAPSGEHIYYFMAGSAERTGIYQTNANGTGTPKLLTKTPAHHMHASPDGRHLVFEKSQITGGGELWTIPLPGGGEPKPYLTGVSYSSPRFSPDSRFVAYDSIETGRYEVYIQTFPAGGGKWQVSTGGGREPKWRRDGKEIYFNAGNKFMSASVTLKGGALQVGQPQQMFDARVRDIGAGGHYAASPDGTMFFGSNPDDTAQDVPIHVLLNWPLPGRVYR